MSDDEEIIREGTCVRDVAAQDFIKALAKYLKRGELVTPPDYTSFTKTAVYKESAPLDADWFYIRCAAVARKVYLRPIGVGQLTRSFGGKARRGTRTNKFHKSSRGIIRTCLTQLKAAGYVEGHRNGGCKITQEGQKALDTIAVSVRYPEADEDDE
jgi:small subunit ribosomal protein S19e